MVSQVYVDLDGYYYPEQDNMRFRLRRDIPLSLWQRFKNKIKSFFIRAYNVIKLSIKEYLIEGVVELLASTIPGFSFLYRVVKNGIREISNENEVVYKNGNYYYPRQIIPKLGFNLPTRHWLTSDRRFNLQLATANWTQFRRGYKLIPGGREGEIIYIEEGSLRFFDGVIYPIYRDSVGNDFIRFYGKNTYWDNRGLYYFDVY